MSRYFHFFRHAYVLIKIALTTLFSKVIIKLKDHKYRQVRNRKGIVQLHEENQSFLQMKQFDWENGIVFTFKNKTKLVMFH